MKTLNITSGNETTTTTCEDFTLRGNLIFVNGLQGNSINLPMACDNGYITIEGTEVRFGRDGYLYQNDIKLTLVDSDKENWDQVIEIRVK